MRLLSLLFTVVVSVVAFAQAPTITNINPKAGAPGSTVTITGTGFNATASNNVVYFGSVKVPVASATTTSLTVVVPSSASNGKVLYTNINSGKSTLSDLQFSTTWSGGALNSSNLSSSFSEVIQPINPVNVSTGYAWYDNVPFNPLASGDFNVDGKIDLIVATGDGNSSALGASIYKNASTGIANFSFATPTTITTSTAVQTIQVVDLNADGRLDVILGSVSSATNSISIFLNISSGATISFGSAYVISASNNCKVLKVSDINTDGKIDILYASSSLDKVYACLNTSPSPASLSFGAPTVLVTASILAFEVGDVNNDNKPDLILGPPSATPQFYLNQATAGTFPGTASFSSPSGTFGPYAQGENYVGNSNIVDFDNDGYNDFASGKNGSVLNFSRNTYTSTANTFGAFTSVTCDGCGFRTIGTVDLDGDGDIDLMGGAMYTPPRFQIMNNTSTSGAISFSSYLQLYLSGSTTISNIVADLDNNGKPEYITLTNPATSGNSQLSIMQNKAGEVLGISAHPSLTNQTYCQNAAAAALTITASGSSPSYQWEQSANGSTGWANVSAGTGATTTSFTPSTATAGVLYYRCKVTDASGTIWSNASGSYTIQAATATTNPSTSPQTVCQGGAFTAVTVTPSGVSPTVQWETSTTSGGTYSNATGTSTLPSYTPPANVVGVKYYRCKVTGTCGTVYSNPTGAFTVNALPTFSAHPSTTGETDCQGGSFTALSVTASNYTTIQWFSNTTASNNTGTSISGATSTTYTPSAAAAGTLYYYAAIGSTCGSVKSNVSGAIVVNANPTLTTNLTATAITLCYSNTPTNLTVAASGSPSYQWQVSSTGANGSYANVTATNGANGTTSTFTPSHANIWYGGTKYYQCVVSENGCSTTSTAKQYNIYADLTWTNPSNAAQNICINGSSTALSMTATGPNVVYSWQKSPNGTSSWTTISGANTNTYTPPTNVAGVNYYRCYISGTCSNTATASSGAITVTDTYTWTGATSTNPTVAGNWNPAAVPCSGANEVIPSGLTNYPVYTNLTIDAGTTLTVNTGGRLTVTGTLTNNGTMTIESGATFVQGTSLAGSGTYNVKQFVTGAGGSTPSGRFWYMGLPINNLSRQTAFGAASASNRLWSWSESAQAWSSQITDATALSPTTGYVFRTGADVTLTFTGTSLYSADASITGLTNTTGSFDGCHLMSNPYTAYLDWDQIAAAAGTTNLSSTVTVRSYNTSNSQMVYDTYNATGSVAVQNSSYAVSKYIAPMQSFWVVVNPSTTGTLSMTKAMLTHQPTAPGLKDLTSFPAFARLNLVDGSFTDQVVVYTDAEANAELEAFDSKKFFLPNVAQVYCKVGNDKLVINALKKGKAQTSAPLTVELPSTKVYKFEMAESFVDNGLVILEDRQEGIFQDMGINPTYEFFGNSGVIADRFVLHFQLPNGASNEGQANIEDLTSSQIAVISNQNGSILVSLSADLTATGEVQVLDAAGRLIQTAAIKGQDTKLQITEGTGVYFVRVSTPMKSETKKVLIY